jgi:dienelactone hydrolase
MSKLAKKIKKRIDSAIKYLVNQFRKINFNIQTIEGGLIGLSITIFLFYLYLGSDIQSGLGRTLDTLVGGGMSILVFAAMGLVTFLLLKLIKRLSEIHLSIFVGLLFLAGWFWDYPFEYLWPLTVVWVLGGIWFGSAVISWINYRKIPTKPSRRIFLSINLFLVSSLFAYGIYWFFSPGTDAHVVSIDVESSTKASGLSDPSISGDFEHSLFSYGSGEDRWREAYGVEAKYITNPVNASAFYSLTDWETTTREFYWGFSSNRLPINGRVWMPDGEGPFPLVMMVHGNHQMNDYSDDGYAYLGEMLASQGYIFVSIDENFFNGYWSGGVSGENDARAWVILQHLSVWKEWNRDASHDLFKKIDMESIALVGHSRGGEAVALAATFNQLKHYPSNANFRWNFNFGIKSVIAVAPTDQQYSPAGHPNPLLDVNYLVLQGAHDADVSSYYGFKQYQRVSFSDSNAPLFKAGLYIYQANHGQFNSAWGEKDFDIPKGNLLNRRPLLPMPDQQKILTTYLAGFLNVTIKGEDQYVEMFQDYRVALDWLPKTQYINQFQAASFELIANFEEDIDVTTISAKDGRAVGQQLSRWREEKMLFRKNRSQENHALVIGWSRNNGKYQLFFENPNLNLSNGAVFSFLIANKRSDIEKELIDFTIVFEDKYGNEISCLLSDKVILLPQLPVKISKLEIWEDYKYKDESEVVFQTVRIPMVKYLASNSKFDVTEISIIKFIFDQGMGGEIIIDEIGWEMPIQ